MSQEHYVGRFAPSPTGPLHAGSLVAALASWLDARAHGGRWLLRIEDTDAPRCVPGADREILGQLGVLGLVPDEPPLWQSRRTALYQQALDGLAARGQAYPCGCTRRDIEAALAAQGHEHRRHEERVYPGTCRDGLHGKPARAWRLRCGSEEEPVVIDWHDRRLGAQRQDLTHAVGDFILKRADGIWSYQLAVVVDDALQGVTHVVRGEDLADNTPRQLWLQRQLAAPAPTYLHLPLVLDARGEKLSKQHGAPPLALDDPLAALRAAARALDLPENDTGDLPGWLARATAAWARRWTAPARAAR
ncbi:tRNA glutamyl-Q(34) synthetase GluQRS [Azohydromonas aeria]|uniref:tRNA glutamyl-Q(34) synthetase GluQRS n=1 Tax=Azohydromonas aeria TaxID=2590212 RepID=UPI0012F7A826|nr:tRNA glutamyl-Q(34) synthetase GluQRS [Azohydromonas aeria]